MSEQELLDIKEAFEDALDCIEKAEGTLDSIGFVEGFGWAFEGQKKKLRQLIKETDEEIADIHYHENMQVMADSMKW